MKDKCVYRLELWKLYSFKLIKMNIRWNIVEKKNFVIWYKLLFLNVCIVWVWWVRVFVWYVWFWLYGFLLVLLWSYEFCLKLFDE